VFHAAENDGKKPPAFLFLRGLICLAIARNQGNRE
jgi:hypothetical protein